MKTLSTTSRLFVSAWLLALRNWKPMLVLAVLVWICGAIVFWPLISFMLAELAVYQDVIVGNYTTPFWLLTPRGLFWLLLMGSASLLSAVVYVAGMFIVLNATGTNGLWGGFRSFTMGLKKFQGLFVLSLRVFLQFLPYVLGMLVGPGLAYLLLLSEHDINYYLTHHPPQWYCTLGLGALWVLVGAVFLLKKVISLMFAFPCWLDKGESLGASLRASSMLTRSNGWSLFRAIVCGGLVVLGVALLLDGLNYLLTMLLLHIFASSVEMALQWLVLHVVVGACLDSILYFIASAWVACLFYLAYAQLAGVEVSTSAPCEDALPLSKILNWKMITLVCLALLAISQVVSRNMLHTRRPVKTPVVIAHRAGAAHAPENSMAALRRVLKDGATDIVEIDVQASGDGQLVVAHDKDLMKQAKDPRVIGDTPYADLAEVDLGVSFSDEFAGEHLEPFGKYLKRLQGELPVIVEFKFAARTNLVDMTVAAIREHQMEESVILMSLELNDVRQGQDIAPDMKHGYFVSVELGALDGLDVEVIGLKDGLAKPALIQDLHDRGMLIYSWTIDDPHRMVELMEMGVDGLITNDPLLCQAVVDRYAGLNDDQRLLLRYRRFWKVLRTLDIWGR